MVIRVDIKKGKKWTGVENGLGVLSKNINNYTKRATEKQLLEIHDIMRRKISVFTHTGELLDGLVIDTPRSNDEGFTMRLRSTAPHSLMNEEGVDAHWVNYYKYPKLEEWVYANYDGDEDVHRPGVIRIGGPNSRIQKGNSQNQFFRPSIEQFLSGNKSRAQFTKALRDALEDTFK